MSRKKKTMRFPGAQPPPRVVGDPAWTPPPPRGGSRVQRTAKWRRSFATPAERRLETFLNQAGDGALEGKFQREWGFGGKYILDFFFHEVRLGIEVDGAHHRREPQETRDRQKEAVLKELEVTLLRITNAEVFGDEERLLGKLRAGWKAAKLRKRGLFEPP